MSHRKADHLSRLAAPKSWPIKRKQNKWISKPEPGSHTAEKGMPISVYLTEILGYTKNKAEARKVLRQGLVLVNSKAVKEANFIVGLFDTLQIQKYNKNFRVLLTDKGKLKLIEIPEKETSIIPLRVEGKTTIKGGKTQVNFSNGWNLIVSKDEYKVNDVVLFDSKDKKTVKHIKLEKGNLAYIIGGTHSGKLSEIKEILQEGVLRKKKFIVGKYNDEKIKVPIRDIFVIGTDKAEISL